MIREPDQRIPGAFVSSPVYVAMNVESMKRMLTCKHTWPEELPKLEPVDGASHYAALEKCTACGATRCVYSDSPPPKGS